MTAEGGAGAPRPGARTPRPHGEPWDRWVRESPIQFEAFQAYLGGASNQALAAQFHRHRNRISAWKQRFRWEDRREALEQLRDRELHEKVRQKRRQVVERHLQLLDGTEALIAQGLSKLDGKVEGTISQMALALQRVIVGQRVVLGMPTEVVVNREGPPVSAEELSDAASILRDPSLIEEFDKLAERAAAAGRRSVAGDAGCDGREAQQGPVAPGPAPEPPQP